MGCTLNFNTINVVKLSIFQVLILYYLLVVILTSGIIGQLVSHINDDNNQKQFGGNNHLNFIINFILHGRNILWYVPTYIGKYLILRNAKLLSKQLIAFEMLFKKLIDWERTDDCDLMIKALNLKVKSYRFFEV